MSLPEIEAIRSEHREEGIGPQIYALLTHVVRTTAIRYPPRIYAQTPRWDEGTLEELMHDWVIERLVRGDLSLMVGSSATTSALRNQLSTSLRQLIINRRRRDSAGNLYRRTLARLKAGSPFVQVTPGSASHGLYSLLADPRPHPSGAALGGLVKLAFELSDEELEVVRYGASSLKSSPILREPALERFLVHLLEGSEGALGPTRISEVMAHRFSLLHEEPAALEEHLNDAELVATRVETDEIASFALEQLEPAELALVELIAEHDWDCAAAAEQTEQTRAPLEAAAARLIALVAELAGDEEQALAAVAKISESLFISEQS